MFLQVIATGMVSVEMIASGLVRVIRNEDRAGPFKSKAYKIDANWHVINLRDGIKKRQHKLDNIGRNRDTSSAKKERVKAGRKKERNKNNICSINSYQPERSVGQNPKKRNPVDSTSAYLAF